MGSIKSEVENFKIKYKQYFIEYINTTTCNSNLKFYLTRKDAFEEKDFQIYLIYPLLFSQAFGIKENEQLKMLCTSGFLYYSSLISIDRMIDAKNKATNPENIIYILSCQEEAIKLLAVIFKEHPGFWKIWNQRKEEFYRAISSEKNNKITNTRYKQLADGKSAFAKIAIDALHILSGKKHGEAYRLLLQSHAYFSLGMQLIDDSQDMEEDMENGQYNRAWYETMEYLERNNIPAQSKGIPDIKKYFYMGGVAGKIYKQARDAFREAKKTALQAGALYWAEVIQGMEDDAVSRADAVQGYIKIIAKRKELLNPATKLKANIILPQHGGSIEKAICSGLHFIINEWENGFGELKHIMYLSNLEGFSKKQQVHTGGVFQRALVLDSLLDARDKLNINLDVLVQHEINYLLSSKLKGGWSYFPSVPEIAPDADDLGQILQVLYRVGKTGEIRDTCIKSINMLLSDNTLANGGIETWIVPKQNKTKIQEKQEHFNSTKWGKGPDNEVMANFLYGLGLYSFNAYTNPIENGCRYLLQQQTSEGFWASRWYYGNFYGTYTCLRLLKFLQHTINVEKPVQKALHYIVSAQKEDGGWGWQKSGDPLNTSLVLLCLDLFERPTYKNTLLKGMDYLLQSQHTDKSWVAVDFIKPKMNEPYRSKTLTTSYVVKALSGLHP